MTASSSSHGSSWRPRTQAVRGALTRTGFCETSEALFLTQGFVYDNSEAAEARFKGDDPRPPFACAGIWQRSK